MPAFLYILSAVSYRRAISHMGWETFEKAAERIQGVFLKIISGQKDPRNQIDSSVLPTGWLAAAYSWKDHDYKDHGH